MPISELRFWVWAKSLADFTPHYQSINDMKIERFVFIPEEIKETRKIKNA